MNTAQNPSNSTAPALLPTLLIVDDDTVFRNRLARAMERKGYAVQTAADEASAADLYSSAVPDYAVLDMRLEAGGNGLNIARDLHSRAPDCRIVMLTGYGNIASAVVAVKAGAIDYLAKPADADDIDAALREQRAALPAAPADPMPADRVRWEHIARVFEQTGRNISETARRLKMHRRTLQRILAKYAPEENSTGE